MSVTNLSGLFQTVVAAATEATQLLAPTHDILNAIYWDHRPDQPGILGQTLNVAIPQDPTSQVQDIGTGDGVLSDIGFNTVAILFNKHPYFGFPVRDYEQFNTPYQIRTNFLDAALTGVKNKINAQVAALFTTANFTTNTAVSATSHVVTVPQFLAARTVLADQYVNVNDSKNMTCVLPSTPYMAMMDGTTGGAGAAWTQAFIVGSKTAESIHEQGEIPVAFSTTFRLDQQMPTTGAVGSRTFTGFYGHRYAVAGVSRAIATPPEAMKVVDYTYIDWNGLSIRVMMGYNQFPKGGLVVTIDAGYGLKVVRENMGVLLSIAE